MSSQPKYISICTKCNFVTVQFESDAWNCMSKTLFKKHFNNDLDKVENKMWCCDNCINQWSVDNGEQELYEQKAFVGWNR